MVTWKKIRRGEGVSREGLAAFWAERSPHALEVELQNGPPGKKLYLLPGWEREQWEYASREEARMDWALMIIPRGEYRQKLLQCYPNDDPDAFLAKMVERELLFEIPLEDGTVGILYTRDFYEKLGGPEKPDELGEVKSASQSAGGSERRQRDVGNKGTKSPTENSHGIRRNAL